MLPLMIKVVERQRRALTMLRKKFLMALMRNRYRLLMLRALYRLREACAGDQGWVVVRGVNGPSLPEGRQGKREP